MSELARWPSATDYIDVVQHPALVFTHDQMKEARFDLDMYGIPDGCTGSNAVVFRAMLGPKTAALRCFISQAGLSRDRYLALARHVSDEARGARWMVPATWWDEAVKVKGQHWPIVEMEWVDGRPLDIYVGSLCQTQPAALHLLAARWREMLRDLGAEEVAHGDLQHGNVLVDQTTVAMRLVDLDSAWVPGMDGLAPPTESGHQAFRHPNRPDSDQWGPNMDTFAGLVVLVSLLALAHQPGLWTKYNNGDNLLFTADDFIAVDASPLWADLGTISDGDFADLLMLLKACCAPDWQPSGTLEDLIVEWQGRARDTLLPAPETEQPTPRSAPWAPPAPPVPPRPDTPDVQTPLQDGLDWEVNVDKSSPARVVAAEPVEPAATPPAANPEPVQSSAPPTELPPPPIVQSATMNAPVENTVLAAPTDANGDTSNPFRPPPMARGKGAASKSSKPKPGALASMATGYMGWAVFATLVTAFLAFPVYVMARRARAAGRSGDVAAAIERSHRAKRVAVTIVVIMVIAGVIALASLAPERQQRMRVFISYRRRDDPNFAWRLRDQCARHIGEDNIFFDIDSVYFGADFVETIRRLIAESDCMLVAIGPAWDPRRLFDEEDYVRMEVLEAASQGKLLIPVLNGDTTMPPADALPGPLQFLSRRNAAIVQPERLNRDVEALVTQIRLQLPPEEADDELPRPAGESIEAEVRRLRVPTMHTTAEITGHEGHVLSVAFDTSGELLASGGSDNTARLWDVAGGEQRLSVTAKGGRVCSVAIDGSRDELLSSSNDVVHLWGARSGGRRTTLAGHTGSVWALALSPDGATVATASADNSACVWDLTTARRLLTLRDHTGWVTAVTYSPSGDCVATGSTDNTCMLWDPTTGRLLRTLRRHTRSVTSIAFSHDQRLLATASADGTARVWDVHSGQEVHALNGHRESVTSVAFTPDDELVVTAGVDGSCRGWDPTSGRLRRAFLGHERPVRSIAISPDGSSLASASDDGTIRMWSING